MPTTQQLSVRDVMTTDPVCVTRSDTVAELAKIFAANQISGTPVVDATGRLIGVVSKTDLIRHCLDGPIGSRQETFFERLADGLPGGTDLDQDDLGVVEDLMTAEPTTARTDETLAEVAARMADGSVHRVIVIDDDHQPIGIVSALDVLRHFPRDLP